MRELDIGKFRFVQRDDFLAPQHAGLEHVGLVDRTDLVPSRPRQLESGTRDAANLIGGVLLGVEAAALPVGERLDAARLAEINAAGQFADDDEIDVPEHAGLERRRIRQRRMGDDRPEIGVEIVFAAQAEQAPRLARRGGHFLGLRAAGRAPQDRVGLLHRLDGVRRHHLAGREIGNDAVLRFAQHHGNAALGGKPVEHALRLRGHFGADALAADHGDLDHVGPIIHADFLPFSCKMDPGPLRPVGRLKGADFVVALQCQRDFVETFQQAFAPARIDRKLVPLSRRRDDRLLLQVDADAPGPLGLLHLRGKAIDDLLVDDDRQDAVLEAIGKEDVAKARADDGADAHFLQRPDRAFARGAAAEIRTGNENFRLPIGLAVQDEFGIFRTVGQIAQRAERPFAERAANGVSDQPLDADDDVGIDIAAHDRGGNRRQGVERFWHVSAPSFARRRWRRRWRLPPHWPGLPDGYAPAAPGGRQNCGWRSRPSADRGRPFHRWRQGTSSIRARAIRSRHR